MQKKQTWIPQTGPGTSRWDSEEDRRRGGADTKNDATGEPSPITQSTYDVHTIV